MPKNRLPSVKPFGRAGAARRTWWRRRRREIMAMGRGAAAASACGKLGEHRRPGRRLVARLDAHRRVGGDEDVHARAEADEAEPRTLLRAVPLLAVRDDAAGDETGDLPDQDAVRS